MNALCQGSLVYHANFGRGVVEFWKGDTTLVRFNRGIEECLSSDLTYLRSAAAAYLEGRPNNATSATLRLLGETVRAVNDAWGVFSPSRIDLYPHQLWVCRKVTEHWPIRWVVADDVGLGKTIEAGLVLWRLFHLGLVRRLLILCPASLVEQWQQRLFSMFDIRLAQYNPRQDTKRVDFWRLHPLVVASFHTLREDRDDRHERMTQADPWDLIIVDEAHHLNVDEQSGMTLAHRLIRRLQDAGRLESLLLFTGTPHRGKHYGFLALMALVRPDLFDPRRPVDPQLKALSQALVRNNKYRVTNLKGERLFRPPIVSTVSYSYTASEAAFYRMMTEFIASGRAYASGLQRDRGRTVMLVVTALQKLASSSVAAVRSALSKRLRRLRDMAAKVEGMLSDSTDAARRLDRLGDDADSANAVLEDEIATMYLELMENECQRLSELITAADNVVVETKVATILNHVRGLRPDESVLFFTEYKVTQALLLTSLWREFGGDSATFINGDEALLGVILQPGVARDLREPRESAKARFNSGQVRFLVSTEAAGEGIDLQERCSRLIHVDLPWNPMRLHQRVGRLNRIGQREVVKVMLFQNPDTVEFRIWELLNQKLERIRCSINAAAEQPEDLHQLVLGIDRPSNLDTVFAAADQVPRARLEEWFDQATGQLGGEDAVRVVQNLIGHAQHFDFAEVSDRVPKLDLPDLAPFFRLIVRHNRRQISETNGMLAFKTPEAWLRTPGIRPRYDDAHFNRRTDPSSRGTILGIGSRVFDTALEQALRLPDCYAVFPCEGACDFLFVFRTYDRVTGNPAQPKSIMFGVIHDSAGYRIMMDWQLLLCLNHVADSTKVAATDDPPIAQVALGEPLILRGAESEARAAIPFLGLPFRQPDLELLGVVGLPRGVSPNLRTSGES